MKLKWGRRKPKLKPPEASPERDLGEPLPLIEESDFLVAVGLDHSTINTLGQFASRICANAGTLGTAHELLYARAILADLIVTVNTLSEFVRKVSEKALETQKENHES